MSQQVHPKVRIYNDPKNDKTPKSCVVESAAVSKLNVKIHDSALRKKTAQIWLVWRNCQEKASCF